MFSGHALYVVSFPWTPTVLSHRIRELLELSARRKRRNTLLSLHKKKKTIVVLLLWRTSLSEWNDNDDEKASQCHASPSVLSLSFKQRRKKEKKNAGYFFLSCETSEVASSSTSWRAALLRFSFSRSRVNCTSATSCQQAVLEGRLSPVGCAGWIRRSDS